MKNDKNTLRRNVNLTIIQYYFEKKRLKKNIPYTFI